MGIRVVLNSRLVFTIRLAVDGRLAICVNILRQRLSASRRVLTRSPHQAISPCAIVALFTFFS